MLWSMTDPEWTDSLHIQIHEQWIYFHYHSSIQFYTTSTIFGTTYADNSLLAWITFCLLLQQITEKYHKLTKLVINLLPFK